MSDRNSKQKEDESYSNYIRLLSHQLKSPINSIESLLNTISEGFTGETSPKTLYLIEKAVDMAADAKEIISDLLDYELYSRNQPESQEEFDIVFLMSALVNRYTSRAAEKNISLHADLSLTTKIYIFGDSRGLEHAFRNIVENAIKYTSKHGDVTVTLTIFEAEKTCHIDVTDTGYGIPEDELKRIFDPFYRSIKHKFNVSGTGLGLPMVKGVITNHNGTITVESQEDKGTTFRVTLPYNRIVEHAEKAAERKKVVIIGGTTAGPKAASRIRRLDENIDITIIEKSEFLSYSGCGLPWYISDRVSSPKALMSSADNTIRDVHFFETIKNIHTLNNTVALEIHRERRTVTVQDLKKNAIEEVPYDDLILATGTEFLAPKIPGIRQKGIYSFHSLEEAKALKKELSQTSAQDVCIIGGGLIGTSMAESLVETGARVTILEKRAYILFDLMDRNIALKIQNELNKKGIKIITEVEITEIEKTGEYLTILTNGDSYHADFIILATGVTPNIVLAKKVGLEIGDSGGIRVTPSLQTSDEHIYAVGDCAESVNLITGKHEYWPLGSTSIKMGRIAADNICGRPAEFHGSIGTAMFKIFDLNVARTGLTYRNARENGFDAETAIVTGLDKVHYCEDAEYGIFKVIADRETKRILGAQGYGRGNLVPKIQMLACAINQSMTLDDVFQLDLGHAPPFNTPFDIVQIACLVLDNKIENLFKTITLEEFEREKANAKGIIDVSPLSEHTLSSIPGSINIPLENLRLEDIPFEKNANVILYSKTSSGAYQAYRYLVSRGYSNLRVLEGGYVYWE